MNDRMHRRLTSDEQLIDTALASLEASTGIMAKLAFGDNDSDGRVQLSVAGTQFAYQCEIKRNVDRVAMLDDIKVRSHTDVKTLLITTLLTSTLAERCQELGIEFIDTAGNAFITNDAGILISIRGRKTPSGANAPGDKAVTPAALRMMFAFLTQPTMLNAPYREIAASVHVSTGAIGSALDIMEARGFIGTTAGGRRVIDSPTHMLSDWATGYAGRLRPKLQKFRFAASDPNALDGWKPEKGHTAWGGEVAAEKITGHLKPSTVTIYMDMSDPRNLAEFVKRFKLRADQQGPIELVQAFWHMDRFAESFPTVPLHLVYADLLATNDSRNLVVAKQIHQQVIDHVHRSGN